ncbi:hypothetical protein CBL_20879, partial [Carabus blaptoides fortunei]
QHHAVVMIDEQIYKLKLNNPNKIRPSFHVMKDSALSTIKRLDIYWRNRNYEIEDNTTNRKESFEIDDGYQPINMEHLQPAFILLACGLILAAMQLQSTGSNWFQPRLKPVLIKTKPVSTMAKPVLTGDKP